MTLLILRSNRGQLLRWLPRGVAAGLAMLPGLTPVAPSLAEEKRLDCAIEHAVYAPKDDADHEMLLRPTRAANAWTDFSFLLVSRTSGRSFAFDYTASAGYPVQYLLPKFPYQGEEPSSFPIFFFDENLKSVLLPRKGKPAPPYMFPPTLGRSLWSETQTAKVREEIASDIWVLADCR